MPIVQRGQGDLSRWFLRSNYLAERADHHKLVERRKFGIYKNENLARCANHLLIVGFGASERRTLSYIEHAWTHLKGFTVFWVCHTSRDVEMVERFRDDYIDNHGKSKDKDACLVVIEHTQPGLLFLQMFQVLRRTLPRSGAIFPSVAQLSLPPSPKAVDEKLWTQQVTASGVSGRVAELVSAVKSYPRTREAVVVTAPNGSLGVTSICSRAFSELESSYICLWVDMNDVVSTTDLFEKLLDAIYYRLGIEEWMPMRVSDDPMEMGKAIMEATRLASRPWAIFINARETPGANRPLSRTPKGPNGWLDLRDVDSSLYKQPYLDTFITFLTSLYETYAKSQDYATAVAQPLHPVVPVLIIRLENDKDPELCKALDSARETKQLPSRILKAEIPTLEIQRATDDNNAQTTAKKVWHWAKNTTQRTRFVHRLIIMRRLRHLAVIWHHEDKYYQWHTASTKGPMPGQDGATDPENTESWLSELEKKHLVRQKPGGFIWIHTQTRQKLREIFSAELGSSIAAERHVELVAWYEYLIDVTRSPDAVFEAVYHACQATENLPDNLNNRKKQTRMLVRACALLRAHRFLLQTRGYSKRKCSALDEIRAFCKRFLQACKSTSVNGADNRVELLCRLNLACIELMRAIAREVGEDWRALKRHDELCDALCSLRNLSIGGTPVAKSSEGEDIYEHEYFDLWASVRTGKISVEEWLRYWRWSGMLGMSSRSYCFAWKAIATGLSTLIPPNGKGSFNYRSNYALRALSPHVKHVDFIRDAMTRLEALFTNRSQGELLGKEQFGLTPGKLEIEVLRLVEQTIACALLRYHLQHRQPNSAVNITSFSPRSDAPSFQELNEWVGIGMRLIELLLGDTDLDRRADILLYRSRLLMHSSIVEASQLKSAKNNLTNAAVFAALMGHLMQAETGLDLVDASRHGTDKALVDLHRAELRLIQVHALLSPDPFNGTFAKSYSEKQYKELQALLFSDPHTIAARNAKKKAAKSPQKEQVSNQQRAEALLNEEQKETRKRVEGLRSTITNDGNSLQQQIAEIKLPSSEAGLEIAPAAIQALLSDSYRFLNRAEAVLRTRRRNVWWATWLFERKLRAIALSVLMSAFERQAPDENPKDQGRIKESEETQEEQKKKKAPIPFLGLEAAPRRTPTVADELLEDAVRMIRVDAYRLATVIEAYALNIIALKKADSANDLYHRQEDMRAALSEAVEDLEETCRRRSCGEKASKSLDDDVCAYVTRVYVNARILLSALEAEALRDSPSK